MKEWICEEVPALTVDGKVIDTMLLMKKEIVRYHECKYFEQPFSLCKIYGVKDDDWFCADGEKSE